MALSEHDVRAIAEYARIGLDDEELHEMTAYMNDAVAMLKPIVDFDPEGVEPTFHPIGDLSDVMRDDAEKPGLSLESALENAHATEGRLFRVPCILGGGGLS